MDPITGLLLEHGIAPLDFIPKAKNSYFVRIQQDGEKQTLIWDKGLKKAIEDSGARRFDQVELQKIEATDRKGKPSDVWEAVIRNPRQRKGDPIEETQKPEPSDNHDASAEERAKTDEPGEKNQIRTDAPSASRHILDINQIPDAVKGRYLVASKVPGQFFFRDREQKLAFADKGGKLVTSEDDQTVVLSMIEVCKAKGWGSIQVKGSKTFQSETWLHARLAGIEVKGFKPSASDMARLEDQRIALATNSITPISSGESTREAPHPLQDGKLPEGTAPVASPLSKEAIAFGEVGRKKGFSEERVSFLMQEVQRFMEIAADLGIVVPSPKITSHDPGKRVDVGEKPLRHYAGILLDHGKANYQFAPDEKPSYWVKIQSPKGDEKTVWGVDLERAIKDGQVANGESINLDFFGNRPVTVMGNKRDASGNVVGQEEIESMRNTWNITRPGQQPNLAQPKEPELKLKKPRPISFQRDGSERPLSRKR